MQELKLGIHDYLVSNGWPLQHTTCPRRSNGTIYQVYKNDNVYYGKFEYDSAQFWEHYDGFDRLVACGRGEKDFNEYMKILKETLKKHYSLLNEGGVDEEG